MLPVHVGSGESLLSEEAYDVDRESSAGFWRPLESKEGTMYLKAAL